MFIILTKKYISNTFTSICYERAMNTIYTEKCFIQKKKKKILVFRKQTSCLQEARLRQQGVEKVGLFTLFLPLPYQSKKKKKRCVFGWVCMWNTGVYLCTMIVFGLDNLPAPPPPAKSGTEVNSSSIAANMALCCVDTQSSRYRSFKQELTVKNKVMRTEISKVVPLNPKCIVNSRTSIKNNV